MILFEHTALLKSHLASFRSGNKVIGFVPTMGALHAGHISLIERAKQENNIVVCSIFVNPTQFNEKSDYEKYPRHLERDIKMLEEAGCDILFRPSENEMYPETDKRIFNFGELEKVMEGRHRPGHFNGVALIVSKLFDIVEPDKAYFGQKDFQQVAIIRKMVEMLHLPVNIIACPTLREPDGLAMSSRNMLLNPEERKRAVVISQTLFGMKERVDTMDVEHLLEWGRDNINKTAWFQLEYLEIADAETLQPLDSLSGQRKTVVCIAARLGKVRLIDNVSFGEEIGG